MPIVDKKERGVRFTVVVFWWWRKWLSCLCQNTRTTTYLTFQDSYYYWIQSNDFPSGPLVQQWWELNFWRNHQTTRENGQTAKPTKVPVQSVRPVGPPSSKACPSGPPRVYWLVKSLIPSALGQKVIISEDHIDKILARLHIIWLINNVHFR